MGSRLLLGISATLLRARLRQSIVAAVGVTFSIAMYIALSGFMKRIDKNAPMLNVAYENYPLMNKFKEAMTKRGYVINRLNHFSYGVSPLKEQS